MDTGGKGLYLGGLKEFEDYAYQYYAITPSTTPELEALIAAENKLSFEKKQWELDNAIPEVLVKVCLTNASSSLSYQLAQLVATGAVLGSARVVLHLYSQDEDNACESIAMELHDLASPQLAYVKTTSSLRDAFDGVDLVFLLDWTYNAANLKLCSPDSHQWEEVMERVGSLYHDYAKGAEAWASNNVKVCVTGCVSNVGVAVMAASVPALSRSCIAAPCLAESQARTVLGQHLHIHSSTISQVIIWGRTHGQVLADHSFARVQHFPGAVVGPDPFDLPLSRCEFNKEWLKEEFPRLVALHHQLLDGYREDGPAMAEAVALAGLATRWMLVEQGNEDEEEDDNEEADNQEEEYNDNEEDDKKEEDDDQKEEDEEEYDEEDDEEEDDEEEDNKEEKDANKKEEDNSIKDEEDNDKEEEDDKKEEVDSEKEEDDDKHDGKKEKDEEKEEESEKEEDDDKKKEHNSKKEEDEEEKEEDGKEEMEQEEKLKKEEVEQEERLKEEEGGEKEQGEGENDVVDKNGVGKAEEQAEGQEWTEGQKVVTEQKEKEWDVEDEAWCSVGVVVTSKACYKIHKGLVISLPCRCRYGKWRPVLGLRLTKHIQVNFSSIQIKLRTLYNICLCVVFRMVWLVR